MILLLLLLFPLLAFSLQLLFFGLLLLYFLFDIEVEVDLVDFQLQAFLDDVFALS